MISDQPVRDGFEVAIIFGGLPNGHPDVVLNVVGEVVVNDALVNGGVHLGLEDRNELFEGVLFTKRHLFDEVDRVHLVSLTNSEVLGFDDGLRP